MMRTENPDTQFIDDKDSSFYLDMKVTKDAVYTAEIAIDQYTFNGEEVLEQRYHDVCFELINLYMHEGGNYSPDNPVFGMHWPTNGKQELRNNTRIRVRKNGVEQELINLDRYKIVLDTLGEIYANHDSLDEDIEKRYHWSGYNADDYSYDTNVDICVALWTVQPLNFRFTDDIGNWEMTLCTTGQGSCAPHTVDSEYNSETGENEDVHSWFAICVPLIYYIIRVNSSGQQTILQQWISIKPYTNNLVTKSAWTNAKAMPVESTKIEDRPPINFYSDDGHVTVKGDFSKMLGIYDSDGNQISDSYYYKLDSFDYLRIPDPNAVGRTYGATRKIVVINLEEGISYPEDDRIKLCPFTSQELVPIGSVSYGITIDTQIKRAYYDHNASSYIGRLSICRLKNGGTLAAIFGHYLQVNLPGEDWYGVAPICFNFNLGKIRRKKKMKSPKGIRDLIASRTEGDENDD
jgi:hypothetical protein